MNEAGLEAVETITRSAFLSALLRVALAKEAERVSKDADRAHEALTNLGLGVESRELRQVCEQMGYLAARGEDCPQWLIDFKRSLLSRIFDRFRSSGLEEEGL